MDDKVIVTVPVTALQRFIRSFVDEKAHWIKRRLEENASIRRRFPARRYVSGEFWPLQGRQAVLQLSQGKGRASLNTEEMSVQVPVSAFLEEEIKSEVQSKMRNFYRDRTRALMREPVQRFSQKLNLRIRQVRITNARTLWGSSTSKGTVNFSLRIAMAPEFVAEYLAAHEVAHQVHMNHSKKFWALVASLGVDVKGSEKWLKETGRWLEI